MIATRLHWRLLIGTILILMMAAWLAPSVVKPPDLQENRVLAAKPAWPGRLQDVRAFRQAADAYVADHFPARRHLIGALNRLRMLAGVSGSARVIVGRDGWLFVDDDTHLGAARGDPPMQGPEVRAWLTRLAGRTEMLRARGVPYLIVAPPSKEIIYPQHGPSWYAGPAPGRAVILLRRLAHDSGAGEILYLKPQIALATKAGETTYSRHDTHWSGYGAYAGYVGLMDRLQGMGLTEGPRPLSEFEARNSGGHGPRDLALMLGVSSFVDLNYPRLTPRAGQPNVDVAYLTRARGWTAPQVVDTHQPGKPVLLMTRDSFSNELLPFLYPHFSRIVLAHVQDGFWRPDLIDRFKPDIVLQEVLEPGLRVSMGEGPEPSAQAVARIDAVLARTASPGGKAGETMLPSLRSADARSAAIVAHARLTLNCNVEAADLKGAGAGLATFTGSGWLWDTPAVGSPPEGLVALSGPGGLFVANIRFDKPRPDVAAVLKNRDALASGYAVTFLIPQMPAGTYVPSVYRRAGGAWLACRGGQALVAP